MGCLLPTKPSVLVHIPPSFETRAQQQQQQQQQPMHNFFVPQQQQQVPHAPNHIMVGLGLESQDAIKQLSGQEMVHKQGYAFQVLELTKFIAQDLFNFMSSFTKGNAQNNTLIVPTNVIDRWITRFTDKLKADPYFWKKVSK